MVQSKRHILIAEDEAHTRLGLSLILEKDGYVVSTAANGQQALEQLCAMRTSPTPVNLLIVDIQMPVMTGLELLDEIDRQRLALPTLVITGYGEREMILALMRQGCRDYLEKPFRTEEVLESIRKLVERSRREKKSEPASPIMGLSLMGLAF